MPGPKADSNSNVGVHPGNNVNLEKNDMSPGQNSPHKSVANPAPGGAPTKNSVPLPGVGGSIAGGPSKI